MGKEGYNLVQPMICPDYRSLQVVIGNHIDYWTETRLIEQSNGLSLLIDSRRPRQMDPAFMGCVLIPPGTLLDVDESKIHGVTVVSAVVKKRRITGITHPLMYAIGQEEKDRRAVEKEDREARQEAQSAEFARQRREFERQQNPDLYDEDGRIRMPKPSFSLRRYLFGDN